MPDLITSSQLLDQADMGLVGLTFAALSTTKNEVVFAGYSPSNKELPEVYVGKKEALEKVQVCPHRSISFGGGMFIQGNTKKGRDISLLIPSEDGALQGILPVLNGEPLEELT